MPEQRDADDKNPESNIVGRDQYNIGQVRDIGHVGPDNRTIINQAEVPPPPESVRFTVEFPYPDEKNFYGRVEELELLHTTLQTENHLGIRPAGLAGMGGIGKTQLAVKYAYDYRSHYPGGVYWINAADSLRSQLIELANRLRRQPPRP